jgi:hypothetical protein
MAQLTSNGLGIRFFNCTYNKEAGFSAQGPLVPKDEPLRFSKELLVIIPSLKSPPPPRATI